MKVLTVTPVTFVTGEQLDPDDVNALFAYYRDAHIATAQKRYVRSVLIAPFVTSVASAYTHADIGTSKVEFRFKCPNTCVVERAFLSANMTCSSAVKVDIYTSGGATPDGAASPWLTTGDAVTDATVDTEDVSNDNVLLVAGTEYKIVVSGGGAAVSMQRFDVILHLRTDRWIPSGTLYDQGTIDEGTLYTLGPASTTTATDVSGQKSSIEAIAANFATRKTAPAPMVFHIHGLTSSTDSDLRTFPVPLFDSSRAQGKAVRLYVFVLTGGAGSGGDTCKAELKNAGGTVQATATADTSGAAGWSTGDSGAITTSLVTASSTATTTTANDYSIVFTSNAASTVTKAIAILWISR